MGWRDEDEHERERSRSIEIGTEVDLERIRGEDDLGGSVVGIGLAD